MLAVCAVPGPVSAADSSRMQKRLRPLAECHPS